MTDQRQSLIPVPMYSPVNLKPCGVWTPLISESAT